MKKFGLIIAMLLSIIALTACSSPNKATESKKPIPSGYVEISDPYFKPKEQVQEEFNQLGLKTKFVVTNFDDKAEINSEKLIVGTCDQLSDQPNIEYFNSTEYDNPDNSYYAKEGSTVIIGYSDHEYTPKSLKGSESSSSSVTSSNTSSSESTVTDSGVDELLSMCDTFVQHIKETNSKVDTMDDLGKTNAVIDLNQEYAKVSEKYNKLNEDQALENNTDITNKYIDIVQEYNTLLSKLQEK